MQKRKRESPDFPRLDASQRFAFPPPFSANEDGIVCVGGNLSPGMLLSAYSQGLFPWFNDEDPILWWSPDPRFVLNPEDLHVSDSMRRILRKNQFELSLDHDFPSVIGGCSSVPRGKQHGTWIIQDMIDAYCELHTLGFSHCAEARIDGELVGGLYGVSLGSLFFGESMFSLVPNASKAAFIALVWRLEEAGITLIDSQVHTDHLASLGARHIPRAEYLERLAQAMKAPTLHGSWRDRFPGYPRSRTWERVISTKA